jgi:hypothetical protein
MAYSPFDEGASKDSNKLKRFGYLESRVGGIPVARISLVRVAGQSYTCLQPRGFTWTSRPRAQWRGRCKNGHRQIRWLLRCPAGELGRVIYCRQATRSPGRSVTCLSASIVFGKRISA